MDTAVAYLEARGYTQALDLLKAAKPDKSPLTFKGSSGVGKNRDDFGKIVNEMLAGMTEGQRLESVRVFDNDLEGSCGLHHIRKAYPEIFVRGGIMERGNFSAAAGFGSVVGKQGIFATFSAFLEMCVSEITMSRLNFSNVLAWNVKTGLGSRFGSYLLQAGFKGKYNHVGTHMEGRGGQWQQMGHQGLDSEGIQSAIKALL